MARPGLALALALCVALLAGASSVAASRLRMPRLEVVEDGLYGALRPAVASVPAAAAAAPAAPEDDDSAEDDYIAPASADTDRFRFAANALKRAQQTEAMVQQLLAESRLLTATAARSSQSASAGARREPVAKQIMSLIARVRDQMTARQRTENERFSPQIDECETRAKKLMDRVTPKRNYVANCNTTIHDLTAKMQQTQANLTTLLGKMEVDRTRLSFLARKVADLTDDRQQAQQLFEGKKAQMQKLILGIYQLQQVLSRQEFFNSTAVKASAAQASLASAVQQLALLEVAEDPVLTVGRDTVNMYKLLTLLVSDISGFIQTMENNEKREQDDFKTVFAKLNATAFKHVAAHKRDQARKKKLEATVEELNNEIIAETGRMVPMQAEVEAGLSEYDSQFGVCMLLRRQFRAETEQREGVIASAAKIEEAVEPLLRTLVIPDEDLEGTPEEDNGKAGDSTKAKPGSVADLDPDFVRKAAQAAEEARKQAAKAAEEMRKNMDEQNNKADLLKNKPTSKTSANDPKAILFG